MEPHTQWSRRQPTVVDFGLNLTTLRGSVTIVGTELRVGVGPSMMKRTTSSLGRASKTVIVILFVAVLISSLVLTFFMNTDLLVATLLGTFFILVTWLTRVRCVVQEDTVTFRQFFKTIVVPIKDINSVSVERDSFGLGTGLKWFGSGAWAMLSGGDYLDIHYGSKRVLATCAHPEQIAEVLAKDGQDPTS